MTEVSSEYVRQLIEEKWDRMKWGQYDARMQRYVGEFYEDGYHFAAGEVTLYHDGRWVLGGWDQIAAGDGLQDLYEKVDRMKQVKIEEERARKNAHCLEVLENL